MEGDDIDDGINVGFRTLIRTLRDMPPHGRGAASVLRHFAELERFPSSILETVADEIREGGYRWGQGVVGDEAINWRPSRHKVLDLAELALSAQQGLEKVMATQGDRVAEGGPQTGDTDGLANPKSR